MANKEELSEQLTLTQKLASQMEKMAASAEKLQQSYEGQIGAVEKLAAAFAQMNSQGAVQNIDVLNKSIQDVTSKMKDAGKASESTFQKLGKNADDAGKKLGEKFPRSVAVGVAALSGFVQGVKNMVGLDKGVTSFVSGFADGLVNIATSIIAIPFKMLEGLFDMAMKGAGGSNELAKAIEELRKQFGELYGPTNKTIIDTSKNLKGFSATGLSAWKVFGNLADRLNMMRELATEMGAQFNKLHKEFSDNGGALLAYQKGLGLNNEQMKGLAVVATATGQKMGTVLKDFTKFSKALADSDVDAKLLSRDMGKMAGDVKHFGSLGAKELSEVALYARKLGIEVDKMTGTLDAFESFDTAAENAAKLSQSFGANVDAFKLMEAQNPAEQFDMLRKAMFAAGKTSDTMSRQELKLLAQTTGMDEATAKLAFSMHNQGMGLDQIKKKSGDAEKKTMTQAQAMGKLADAIERMVMAGGPMGFGSFWDAFIKGFLGGIQSTKEFRTIMMDIRQSVRIVYMEGLKLGRAFVQLFPGVKEFFNGISDFFQPAKFKSLVGGTVSILTDWMKSLTVPGGKASFADLMDKLKDNFFSFFDKESPSGRKMLDGFKTIVKTMSTVLSDGIKWMADKMTEGVRSLIDLIQHPEKVKAPGMGGAMGFIMSVLMPIVDALKHSWKVLAPAVKDLVSTLSSKFVEFLKNNMSEIVSLAKPVLGTLALMLFGPAFTRAIFAAMAGSIAKGAGTMLSGGAKKLFGGLAGKAAEVTEQAKKVPAEGAEGLDKVGNVNKAAGEAIDKGKGWGAKDAVSLGLKLVAIATALAIGGVEMAGSVWAMKKILDSAGIKESKDVEAPLLVLGAMALSAVPLSLALKLVSKTGSIKDIAMGGLIISAAIAIVGTVGAGITYLMSKAGKPEDMAAAGNLMLKMSVVFLAMVPLIFASMALGALATGPQAVLLAAAAVGMGVIGGAIGEMAHISLEIVQELNKMKIDTDFQRKIDAFLGIMKGIQTFADTMVNLVGMMAPSFAELLSGKVTSFTDKVDKTVSLMKTMIGEKGSGTGIIGIIELVVEKIRELAIGDNSIAQGAKTFAEVLTAVTEVTRAMTPPPEYFSAQTDFINVLDPSIGKSLDQTTKGYMIQMTKGLTDIMGQVTETIKQLSSINIPNIKQAEAVTNMIGAIANIMHALVPSPETLKSFSTNVEQSAAWGLVKTKVQAFDATSMSSVMMMMGQQFKTLIPVLTSGVLNTVITQAENLDMTKVDKIKILLDVFKMSIDLASALGTITRGANTQVGNLAEGASVTIINKMPDITSLFMGLGQNIGPLVDSMMKVVEATPTDKSFLKKLDSTKTLFSFISELPKLAQTLGGISTGGDVGNTDSLVQAIASVANFLGRLSGAAAFGTSAPPLMELLNNIDAIGKIGIERSGPVLLRTTEMLGKIFDAVSKSSITFTAMQSAVSNATKDITAKGIAPALEAVQAMVKTTNDLNTALSDGNVNKIDIKSKLQNVATAVGLGGKASYTVNPSRNVVITVNMTVEVNAADMEKALVMRGSSIIRNRINWALSDPTVAASPAIPATAVENLPDVSKS